MNPSKIHLLSLLLSLFQEHRCLVARAKHHHIVHTNAFKQESKCDQDCQAGPHLDLSILYNNSSLHCQHVEHFFLD